MNNTGICVAQLTVTYLVLFVKNVINYFFYILSLNVNKMDHILMSICRRSPVFSVVRVTGSLVSCVCFVDHSLTFCLFFWPLCCLPFFDLRKLITHLVSSDSSHGTHMLWYLVARFISSDVNWFL